MSGESAPNYKDTLNLPQTDFPMRGGLAQKEPTILAKWDTMDVYGQIIARRQGAKPFILHDGPPYANGNIHHGHVLNKVLKDFVVKYRTMEGRYAPYVPGWDCHGLPIEHKVDEELGVKKRELTQVDIRRACRAYAERWVGVQREEFKRLGGFGAWSKPYLTMSYGYEAQTLRELGAFFDSGAVYKGLKPVHWSWAAQTALADAEVEYEEYTAPSIYVKFALPQPPPLLADAAGGRPVAVVIWTTTPWTLPANLAIALNPSFEYELVAVGEEALVLASGLKTSALKACRIDEATTTVLARFEGAALVGTGAHDAPRHEARHPFIDRASVLLPAPYVTLEQGTGAVHTAPGHGMEDFQLGREFGLEVLTPVDGYGRYTARFAPLEGENVLEANPKIIAMLVERGALLSHPKLTVKIERYPHCWRTKKPVIFRATEQWFVNLDEALPGGGTLRERALRDIDRVAWVPVWGKERIQNMMAGRPDWCISRQRLWGVPITVMYCRFCETAIVSGAIARHVADLAEQAGADVWFEREPADLCPPGTACPTCGKGPEGFRKEDNILDVWFDSGVSWAAVLRSMVGVEDEIADLYLEGSDQHRGWFNSSLLAGVMTRDHAPFRTVLTHGFVVDEEGHKYSKSSRNFEPPEKMINVDGAEILRLWVAAVDYRGDITLSPTILSTVKDAYRKLRNTWRFLLGNVAGFDPVRDRAPYEAMDALDRWALSRTAQTIKRVREAYESYEFHTIYHTMVRYATVELSSVYLNIIKDRLYANAPDTPARRATQTAVYDILHATVRLMAPILAFTAEEVWEYMAHGPDDPPSVHMADMPEAAEAWIDPALEARFEALLSVGSEVARHIEALRPRSKGARQPGQIGASEEADLTITAQGAELAVLRAFEAQLAEYFIVSRVQVQEGEVGAGDEARVAPVIVTVQPSAWGKCARCWRYVADVGAAQADLCGRCAALLGNA